jgi:hypothetical protein
MKLSSVNALAELFELDRQTVVRALRGVASDGKERGQPRYRMKTAVKAIERHSHASNGISASARGPDRLGVIADELEPLHEELDAAIKLVRSLPDMGAKQPHSRAGMRLLERIDTLYNEANVILKAEDSASLSPYVTPQIVGTYFRLLLAAAYGPKMDIDGVRIFTDEQIRQFGLAA